MRISSRVCADRQTDGAVKRTERSAVCDMRVREGRRKDTRKKKDRYRRHDTRTMQECYKLNAGRISRLRNTERLQGEYIREGGRTQTKRHHTRTIQE